MHPLIPMDELSKLTDDELLGLEARLRDLVLTSDLDDTELSNCLASLRNVAHVRSLREPRTLPGAARP